MLAPAGHPQLPALDEAGISYQVLDSPSDGLGSTVWLAPPGEDADAWPDAQVLHGSADLPGARLIDLVATMDKLRAECPWDARQTHASLAPHLLEEPYEALDALESGDEQAFREELGDVLLQVVFHARIAAERAVGPGPPKLSLRAMTAATASDEKSVARLRQIQVARAPATPIRFA